MYKKVVSTYQSPFKDKAMEEFLTDFYRNPNGKFGRKVLSQLKTLINQLTQDRKINAVWGKVGGGSFMNFESNIITFDPLMISPETSDIKDEIIKLNFVSLHEVVHKLITRYPEFIKEMKDSSAIKTYFEEVAMGALCNSIEDPRDNDYMKQRLPGSAKWQDAFYGSQFIEENTILYGDPNMLQSMREALGHTPNFVIYLSEIIRFWYTGKFSTSLPSDIQSLLDKTKDAFEAAYHMQPKSLDEFEIQQSARESFNIIVKEIWDKGFKVLLEELKELEKVRQQLLDQQDLQQQLLDQLTDDEKQELFNAIQNAIEQAMQQQMQTDASQNAPQQDAQQGQEGEAGGEGMPSSGVAASPQTGGTNSDQDTGPSEAASDGQDGAEQAGTTDENMSAEESQNAGTSNVTKDSDATSSEIPKDWKGEIDWNAMSEELKNKLKEAAKNNSLDEKVNEAMNQAGKALQEASTDQHEFDKSAKEGSSTEATSNSGSSQASRESESGQGQTGGPDFDHSQMNGPTSHGDDAITNLGPDTIDTDTDDIYPNLNPDAVDTDDIAEKTLSAEDIAKVQESSQEIISHMDEISSQGDIMVSLNPYDQVLFKFPSEITKLTTEIGNVLHKNINPEIRYGFDSGNYISMERAMQMEANPAAYDVFGRETTPQGYDFEFLFFIDLSGSMGGNKIVNAFIGLSMVIEALERNSIKNSVIGFNEGQLVIKDFDDLLSVSMRERMSTLLGMPSGGTDDADALEFGYETFKQRPGTVKYMVLLTDGDTGQPTALSKLLAKIASEAVMPLPIALGFGPDTLNLGDHYPISLPGLTPDKFVKSFPPLIQDLMENPQNYLSSDPTRSQGKSGLPSYIQQVIHDPKFDKYDITKTQLPFASNLIYANKSIKESDSVPSIPKPTNIIITNKKIQGR